MVSRHNTFRALDAQWDTAGDTSGVGRAPTLRLPDVGDEVFGFRLKHALGQGAFARVYLAGQDDLAGRPVVLKVSAIEGHEPLTLAQLQHSNIVPIYSMHEDPSAGLRAVCMPYFGGASLSAVLKGLFATTPAPRHGREFVNALGAVQALMPDLAAGHEIANPATRVETPLATLGALDYVRATIWVVARLAEGLQHAHQRGVLHRDIKPSNILISAEGQALLLDYNLAHDRNSDMAEAEAIPGLSRSRALANDRARYLSLLGDADAARDAQKCADRTPARTARDHYLLATSYARQGGRAGHDRAIDELNKALRISPGHYWSTVLRGICHLTNSATSISPGCSTTSARSGFATPSSGSRAPSMPRNSSTSRSTSGSAIGSYPGSTPSLTSCRGSSTTTSITTAGATPKA